VVSGSIAETTPPLLGKTRYKCTSSKGKREWTGLVIGVVVSYLIRTDSQRTNLVNLYGIFTSVIPTI